ncbi:hypothetical protein [Streptomyces sp. NPDC048172]|uniref:hypothetical protein n=1 Tax=Streptomyces sp. NPDC048172 TaxID=3365505 RepID=UPI0037183BB9
MTDVWNALGAVGTCAAAIVAVTIATLDARRHRRSEAEQRLEQADREKEKARTVVATLGHDLSQARISNFGTSPVLNLELLGAQVTVTRQSGSQEHQFRPRDERQQYGWQVVAPGQTVTATIDTQDLRDQVSPGPDTHDLAIDIAFTDADGRIWKRSGDRQPERILDADTQLPNSHAYRTAPHQR